MLQLIKATTPRVKVDQVSITKEVVEEGLGVEVAVLELMHGEHDPLMFLVLLHNIYQQRPWDDRLLLFDILNREDLFVVVLVWVVQRYGLVFILRENDRAL